MLGRGHSDCSSLFWTPGARRRSAFLERRAQPATAAPGISHTTHIPCPAAKKREREEKRSVAMKIS
eukprot:2705045-Rhodomonas_salina.2